MVNNTKKKKPAYRKATLNLLVSFLFPVCQCTCLLVPHWWRCQKNTTFWYRKLVDKIGVSSSSKRILLEGWRWCTLLLVLHTVLYVADVVNYSGRLVNMFLPLWDLITDKIKAYSNRIRVQLLLHSALAFIIDTLPFTIVLYLEFLLGTLLHIYNAPVQWHWNTNWCQAKTNESDKRVIHQIRLAKDRPSLPSTSCCWRFSFLQLRPFDCSYSS